MIDLSRRDFIFRSGLAGLLAATLLSQSVLSAQKLPGSPHTNAINTKVKKMKETPVTKTLKTTPNIIIITTHDTGLHFGCYGVPTIETPAIDGLAREGVKFTKMFSPVPICSPSRCSLLTGQWPENHGLQGLPGQDYSYQLNNPEHHLSHTLRNNGYHTALFGIQHETVDLNTLGFNEIKGYGLTAPEVTTLASDFLRNHTSGDKPFYLQIGFHETHTPYLGPDDKPESSRGLWIPPYTLCPEDEETVNYRNITTLKELKDHIAGLQSSVQRADKAVGILLDALDETGLSENTLILFNTEHGPELPRAKWTMYDAGTNVAFIMRWPQGGVSGGITRDTLLSNVDFLPTLVELFGIDVQHPMDGKSFVHILKDSKNAKPVRPATYMSFIYIMAHAVRTDTHKLIRNFGGEEIVELYDLQKDPLETQNLVDDPAYADIRAELDTLLWKHLEKVNAPILDGMIEYPHIKEFRKEYESRAGKWGDGYKHLIQTIQEGPGRFTVSTDTHLLRVNFTSSTSLLAVQLYDRNKDPAQTNNLLRNPEYAEPLARMKDYFWSWLENENDPILTARVPPPESWERSMRQYRQWRKTKGNQECQ
jgi:arylsulfatase A-like enzyme